MSMDNKCEAVKVAEYLHTYMYEHNVVTPYTWSLVAPERVTTKWMMLQNFVDCGVFAMSHMETFKGVTGRHWKCGFRQEKNVQEDQLTRLREKYAAKILLSDINGARVNVMNEVEVFKKLSDDERAKLDEDAPERIQDRLLAFDDIDA